MENKSVPDFLQAFTDKRDVPFEAATSVSKAAVATATEFDGQLLSEHAVCEVTFPCIVVAAPLFECYLGGDGEPVLVQVSSGTLLWRNPIVGMPHTIIRIVTEGEIDRFVDECAETATKFFELSADEVRAIVGRPERAV